MARRRRSVTDEEQALWHQVARTAVPLHPGGALPPEPPAAVPPAPAEPPSRAKPHPAAPRPVESNRTPLILDPHAALERANPNMDRRRFEALRRGRMEPEARLDLHGLTSERAHDRLTGFILSAHAGGLRLVLVITGKGRPSEDSWQPQRSGILRHSLPHWLAAPPLTGRVLQVAPAHQRHGGTGAFYVYLRRQR